MKKSIFISMAVVLMSCTFTACGGGSNDDILPEEPVEQTSTHIQDMKSFTWKSATVTNSKWLGIASYTSDDEFLTTNTGGMTIFTKPSVDADSPVGEYTITSMTFTACKSGYNWFELNNEKNQTNIGTVVISKSGNDYKVEVNIVKLIDEKGAYAKAMTFTYEGKITKATMLTY